MIAARNRGRSVGYAMVARGGYAASPLCGRVLPSWNANPHPADRRSLRDRARRSAPRLGRAPARRNSRQQGQRREVRRGAEPDTAVHAEARRHDAGHRVPQVRVAAGVPGSDGEVLEPGPPEPGRPRHRQLRGRRAVPARRRERPAGGREMDVEPRAGAEVHRQRRHRLERGARQRPRRARALLRLELLAAHDVARPDRARSEARRAARSRNRLLPSSGGRCTTRTT